MKLTALRRLAALRFLALTGLMLLSVGCKTIRIADSDLLPKTPDPADAPSIESSLANGPFELRIHRIRAFDGTPLHAAQVIRDASFPTVLYFGGNVSRVSRELPMLVKATDGMQVNLLMTDHRGNGRSAGEPSMLNHYHDGIAVYDFARRDLGLSPDRIVVHGMSMGSMKAAYIAAHRPVAGVVLEGSVSTAEAWADSYMPWFMAPFIKIELADTLRGQGALWAVKHQSAPLLVVVGSKDNQTRPKLSKQLYAAAQQAGYPAELLVVEGAGHGNAMSDAGAQSRYAAWLKQALDFAQSAQSAQHRTAPQS